MLVVPHANERKRGLIRIPSADEFDAIDDVAYSASMSLEALIMAGGSSEDYARRALDTARTLGEALSQCSAFIRELRNGLGVA